MHLLLRRADRGVHRRRDDHGSRLRERRLRGHHRERREHRRRGSHRHRRRRDDRPERHRDARGVPLRDRDVPNGSASHPGSGEEASSRGSDEVRPGPVRDGVRPGREPAECRRTVRRDEARPVREPAVRRRDAAHRERAGEPAVPQEPRSTGCFRHAVPWARAWGRDLQAWVSSQPALPRRCRPTRPVPALREQQAGRRVQPVPVLRVQPELLPRVPEPPAPALRVLPVLPVEGPAWGRDGVRPALPRSASRCCRQRDRPLRDRSVQLRWLPVRPCSRTGRIHAVDEPRGPRLWMMRT